MRRSIVPICVTFTSALLEVGVPSSYLHIIKVVFHPQSVFEPPVGVT